jgi:D-sedoheptulose 7-phosphate isomerase
LNFSIKYLQDVSKISLLLDIDVIENFVEQLAILKKNGGRLFVLGVGGSAANSSHAVNDFRKLAGIEAYAPTDNVAEFSARANDEGWETTFEGYLKTSNLTKIDGILILSVGGGNLQKEVSINLCRAIDYANELEATTLAIVGKQQGHAQEKANLCLIIPEVDPNFVTPYSESFQAVIWHLLVSHPKLRQNQTKW